MNQTEPARRSPMLPKELQTFTFLHLLLTVLCLGAEVIAGAAGRGFPYNFPFIPFQGWIDLFCFKDRFLELHHIAFFSAAPQYGVHFMYPAPAALLYRFFYAAGSHALAFFLTATLALVVFVAAIVWRAAVRQGLSPIAGLAILGSAVLFGYPFWFEYMLGNMEICVSLLIVFGILALLRNRTYTAAALFGIAMSIKLFPLVYFALLVSKRQYRQVAFGIAVAAGITLASLWLVYPEIRVANHGIRTNLSEFKQLYMLQYLPVETGFDHSIFGLLKRLNYEYAALRYPLVPMLAVYQPVAAIVGIMLYVSVIRRLPQLNQILSLTITAILLPPTSHDYTLLHLYIPWALLLLYSVHDQKRSSVKGLFAAFVCFAILFAPESEFIYHARGFGGQIKCLVLVVLLVISLRYPFPKEQPAALRTVLQ